MSYELNLENLSGKALAVVKKITAKADLDKNGKIDFSNADENSIFEKELKKHYKDGNLTFDEFHQLKNIMKVDETEETEKQEGVKEPSKKEIKTDNKRIDNTFSRYLDEVVLSSATRENALEKMENQLKEEGMSKEDYQKHMYALESVISITKTMDYNEISDINKNARKVKEFLRNEGMDMDLHSSVLKDVNKMIKTELRQEAHDYIKNIYDEIVKKDAEAGVTRNDREIVKDIKEKLISEKKITGAEVRRQEDYEIDNNAYLYAYFAFINNEIMDNASYKMAVSINEQDTQTKWRDVRSDAKGQLKEDENYDKYARKAFNQRVSGSYEKTSRILSENRANKTNVELHTIQTKDEILKVLGNKSEVFEALKNKGLITLDQELSEQNGQEVYDLSVLSSILREQAGANYEIDRQYKDLEAISEKYRTEGKMAVETGLKETLTEKETEDLLKLCGYPIEKIDAGKVLLGTLLGFVAGGAAAANAVVSTPIIDGDTFYDFTLNVDIKGSFELGEFSGLSDDVTKNIVKTNTGIKINIKDVIEGADSLAILMAIIGPITLKTALATAALGGLTSYFNQGGEIPVTVTNFEETDINKYIERLEHENKPYAEVLSKLALSFVDENGNWDKAAYLDFLNTGMAGSGSVLNKKELLGGAQENLDKLKNQKDVSSSIDGDCSTCVADVTSESTEIEVPVDNTKIHNRKGGDTWKGLVEAYYPGLVEACGGQMYGSHGAIRALKEALSYDQDGTFNQETYKKLLEGGDLPKVIKLPAQINGVERSDGEVKAVNVTGKGKALIDIVGRDDIKLDKIPGADVYKAVDTCDENVEPAYGATPEEAVENLEKITNKKYQVNIKEN